MADPINPRLVSRVGRSLRKRLNTNVKPHLLRCAAHARTEDEFMASAARLLFNPQERQQWLAIWATRRQVEGGDTTPADLETIPAALDAPMQRRFHITPAQRDHLRDALAHELGPIAELLIDNESQRSASVIELLERLESYLENDEQRARFRRATASGFQPDA